MVPQLPPRSQFLVSPVSPRSLTARSSHHCLPSSVVQAGYVRYIGMSSCYAYQCMCYLPPRCFSSPLSNLPLSPPDAKSVVESFRWKRFESSRCAADYAITHNLTPFISMQNQYSLAYREEEREMFPTLKLFGVGSIPWSPLARGLLTRPLDVVSRRGNSDW